VSTQSKTFLTPEEYLEIERKAEYKSEYYRGEMFAMSGARYAHVMMVLNAGAALHQQLRSRPCSVLSADMRVCVSESGLYTYPDLAVVCGERKFLDSEFDTLLNPAVIIEVLSPSTEAYDRGRKFEHYRSIESLREYVLVSYDRAHVDLFTRQQNGRWQLNSADGIESSVELESIGCRLALADVYEKIDFSAAS
jgi:Uma2 family endonuclease